jgi:epoxyqueuosine reductase
MSASPQRPLRGLATWIVACTILEPEAQNSGHSCDAYSNRISCRRQKASIVDASTLTHHLKQKAADLGFNLAAACPAIAPPGIGRFREWLAAGFSGEMRYLDDRAVAYEHPRHILEGVQGILMLALGYRTSEPAAASAGQGRVSRYAWGEDYHGIIHRRLRALAHCHRELTPEARVRGVVDTAPLLEREYGRLSGLGWIGKNTLLLNRRLGSWFFLAALLTDQPLAYDEPAAAEHCGSCRACLDACPTGALVEPYRLDARRCISYLTIELRQAVPAGLRTGLGERLFGCDICQDVCPWNRRAVISEVQGFLPASGMNPLEVADLFSLDDEAFRRRFRGTPLWRARRGGLLRNAAIVLGNGRAERAVPALVRGLQDPDPLVRGASAWALGRYSEDAAQAALKAALAAEADPEVRKEIEASVDATADSRRPQ